MDFSLYALPSGLKKLMIVFVIVIDLGVLLGLSLVYQTSYFSIYQLQQYISGSEAIEDTLNHEIDIEANQEEIQKYFYAKSSKELTITSHNHILSLAVLFLIMGILMFYTDTPTGLKHFLILEPFISLVITFSSMWGLRFISPFFAYLLFISSLMMYGTFFINSFIVLYQLMKKSRKTPFS